MRICPLCMKTSGFNSVSGPDIRNYYMCENCKLIYTDTKQQLTMVKHKTEKAESNSKVRHKNLLNQAVQPALEFLQPGMKGIDYRCGENPVISDLLKNTGVECLNYDPQFFPEIDNTIKYDFIFATECFESFFLPAREFQSLNNLLAENGIIVILTDFWATVQKFRTWAYPKNAERVSFFHPKTFGFIANKYGLSCVYNDDKRVIIMQKQLVSV
jgi:hypothetical protein